MAVGSESVRRDNLRASVAALRVKRCVSERSRVACSALQGKRIGWPKGHRRGCHFTSRRRPYLSRLETGAGNGSRTHSNRGAPEVSTAVPARVHTDPRVPKTSIALATKGYSIGSRARCRRRIDVKRGRGVRVSPPTPAAPLVCQLGGRRAYEGRFRIHRVKITYRAKVDAIADEAAAAMAQDCARFGRADASARRAKPNA